MKIPSKSTTRTIFAAACAASLFCFSSCKDKPKPEEPDKPQAEAPVEPVTSSEPLELDASGYNSKRTQAFGFLSRMPADTEGAFGLRNFSDLLGGILKSNTMSRALAMMQEGALAFDPQTLEGVQVMVDQWVGKEVFVAFGGGSADQLSRLMVASEMLDQGTYKSLGMQIAGGAAEDPLAMFGGIQTQIKTALLDDGSELSKALEAFQFPSMIVGTKVTEGAEGVIAQLDQVEQDLPAVFIVSDFKVGSAPFKSWSVNLQDVVNEGMVAQLNEFLQDDQASQRLADIIRKKKFEFSFGVIDNYLIFGLGTDHTHLKFVSDPKESILAAKHFGFADPFLDKKLVSYAFMTKKMVGTFTPDQQFSKMADAFASGLASGGKAMRKLGNWVKKLGGQLDKVTETGSATYVGVAYMDKGIRGESTGGLTSATMDARTKSMFANAAPQDAALVVSSVAKPEYRGDSVALMETMFSGVEIGVEVWAESSGEPSALEQFQQMNEMFGPNLKKMWGILSGKFLDGLGSQSGLIVDLKGSMPKIPTLPRVLLNEGKVPRIVMAADVVDRAKLAEAWEELVPVLNESLASVPGQEPGAEIQVPDVVTADSDDLATHYFSLPFLSDDFIPSLSVSDELFFLSTSKKFSESLAASAKAGDGDIRGFYMMVNFAEVNRFASEWLNLILQNGEEILGDAAAVESFKEGAAPAQFALDITKGIKGFKLNRYVDDAGAWRSSWHLHVEDVGAAVD